MRGAMDGVVADLRPDQLGSIAVIDDYALLLRAEPIAGLLSEMLELNEIRVAVSEFDFDLLDDGTLNAAAFSASGVWWWAIGDDTSIVGNFAIDGYRLTIGVEGAGESPIAEDLEILTRATKILSELYPGSEYEGPGLFRLSGPQGEKLIRVIVTRDRRVVRAHDMLDGSDAEQYLNGWMGLVVVKGIGIRESGIEEYFPWPGRVSWRTSIEDDE